MLHDLVGEAHALLVCQHTAGNHFTDHIASLDLLHTENDQSVVDCNGIPHRQIFCQLLIVDGNLFLIAHHIIRGKRERIAIGQQNFLVFKGLDTIFRSLGIQHDGNGKVQLLSDLLNHLNLLLMLLVTAVGKVQSCHIHALLTHLCQDLFAFTGRPDGADNFRLSHISTPYKY